MQGVFSVYGVALSTVPDAVDIPLTRRVIAGVKIGGHLTGTVHRHVGGEMEIEGTAQFVPPQRAVGIEGAAEHLCVHPRIGATASDDPGAHPCHRLDGILQGLLNRNTVGLDLPAVIGGAIVPHY